MLEKLSPFFPALLGFVGAVLVAAAGFWASYRQSNFNSDIRHKNEEIARLQNENINNITGGDSFAYIQFQIQPQDGQPLGASESLLLVPIVIHKGKYPLYDVAARIVDVTAGHPFDTQKLLQNYPIGNFSTGAVMTPFRLIHAGKNIDYNVFFSARNGMWTQLLRMRWIGNGWSSAIKVYRDNGTAFEEISENFPRLPDGNIEWERKPKEKDPG